jgi:hypothetical protein
MSVLRLFIKIKPSPLNNSFFISLITKLDSLLKLFRISVADRKRKYLLADDNPNIETPILTADILAESMLKILAASHWATQFPLPN